MTGRLAVASLLVKHIAKTAKGKVNEEQLAAAVDEIELESQIEGASFIKVHLIDPYWTLATSDFLQRSPDGMLDKIECEFPEHSKWWWRLVAVELTNSVTQPNLTLVFEDRIVAWLREMTGEKVAPHGTTTRAQFVKALLDEVHLKDRSKKIIPVIPSLNVVQPVESGKGTGAQEVVESEGNVNVEGILTPKAQANAHAKVNKTPGLGHGAAVTVKGVAITPAQTAQANILLGEANAKGANQVATEALIFAAIAESGLATEAPNNLGYGGVLAGKVSDGTFKQDDSKGMADAFLEGGKGFESALALSKTSHNPVEVAVKVEKPSVWPENAYAPEAGYEHFLAEAQAIIAAGGGIVGGTGSTSGESDIGQLQRGTTQNPDENSFECIERLAKQVRWFAFTDGNRFFYMNGFNFARQKPSAYINLPANTIRNGHTGKKETGVILDGLLANFDNVEYQYQAAHKKRGKAARKSTIAKPASPSEIHVPFTCEPMEYRAGDLFVNQGSGPLDGRWVTVNAVRKYIEDPFTTFTLEPPEEPYPEPLASSKGAEASMGATASVEGYVNPFAGIQGLTPKRVDMGVDFGGSGQLVALGDATVYFVGGAGWPGGGFVGLTLTAGPYKGKHIYHAENIRVSVKQGDAVKAGQPIATMTNAYPFTESGWASGSGEGTLAASLNQQAPGDPGGWTSAAGASFNTLLVSLGCPSGVLQSGGTHGTMPPGYP